MKPAMETVERISANRGSLLGLSTGFRDLDRLTSGLQKGKLILIVGRPLMGKTALAMNIASNVAIQCKKPVGIFSLEATAEELAMRLLCSAAKVNLWSLRDTALSEQDHQWLTESGSELAQAPLVIDDTPRLPIDQLCTRARQMQSQFDIQLLVVDYLQLIHPHSCCSEAKHQAEAEKISLELKSLARELNIPVIVLSHLSHEPEHEHPQPSDWCIPPSIVQDADVVGLLVRPEMYAETEEERNASKGKATLFIAKQRNGPTGDVPLVFHSEYARFENPETLT